MEDEQTKLDETRFRELYYSSLLEQRKENENNRIKIVLISIGATIASILGSITGIQSLSVPFLSLVILTIGYVPWIYMIYILFRKLIVDDKVIDEKIATIGTSAEYHDTPTKGLADKLNTRFHQSLITCLICIICISTYILLNILISGEQEMSKKNTTQTNVTQKVVDKHPTHKVISKKSTIDKSYGGKPPGFMNPDPPKEDPSKPDPSKPDPSKPDPSKPDPPKEDTSKPDPPKEEQDK